MSGIDLVVHLKRNNHMERKVHEIAEVCSFSDNKIILNTLFKEGNKVSDLLLRKQKWRISMRKKKLTEYTVYVLSVKDWAVFLLILSVFTVLFGIIFFRDILIGVIFSLFSSPFVYIRLKRYLKAKENLQA